MPARTKENIYHELRCEECKSLIGYLYAKYSGMKSVKCLMCYIKNVKETYQVKYQ